MELAQIREEIAKNFEGIRTSIEETEKKANKEKVRALSMTDPKIVEQTKNFLKQKGIKLDTLVDESQIEIILDTYDIPKRGPNIILNEF